MSESLFFADVVMSQMDDLINRTTDPDEKARLVKSKQEILEVQKAQDKQDIMNLPSNKKKV